MKKKLLITTSSFNSLELLEDFDVFLNPYGRKLQEEEIISLLAEHRPEALIAGLEPLNRKVLYGAKELKIISRCGVGLDNVDMEAAKELGIKIYNTPNSPIEGVAELTIGLIITQLRHIVCGHNGMKSGEWKREKGNLLEGKKVGIIGCGRIGTRVAELASYFGCEVYGFDPILHSHPYCKLIGFNRLLSLCDIISLHLPLTESTRGLIDNNALSLMKKDAVLVNLARGEIINENALYEALLRHKIRVAILDVYTAEPYQGKLTKLDNVLLSPHQGTNTVEGRAEMEEEAIANLRNYYGKA